MARNVNKFAGIQPVGAGRMGAQKPAATAAGRKQAQQLQELERVKLEGDPLHLAGSGTEPSLSGAVPEVPPIESIGDRLVFVEQEGATPYKVAIGVDGDRTLWFQSTGDVADDSEENGFDWYCPGASTSTMARRMRLTGAGTLKVGVNDPAPSAQLDVEGPIATNIASISGGPTALTAAVTVCDATGATFTVNLPAAANATGCRFSIKRTNAGANTVVVDGNGAETIDGAATKTLASQYACIEVVSDGSNWHILALMGTVT